MNRFYAMALCLSLIAICPAASRADSLLITYQNGATQTVTLDGKSSSIQSLRYLPNDVPAAAHKPAVTQPHDEPGVRDKPGAAAPETTDNSRKSGFRIRWAEPVIGQ